MPASDLARALLNPETVALVGASGDPAKTTARPQRYLKQHGFRGRVIPINATRKELLGERAWPDLRSAPGPIDHAYIMVPAAAVADVVRECGAAGVKVATIFSDGFAEAGAEGIERQRVILEIARTSGLRLLGPNSMGVINVHARMPITVNAFLDAGEIIKGGVGVISQSGTVLGTLLSRGQARGLGFSKLVSVGNEADMSVGEIAEILADDPDTTAILLFLEAVRDGERLGRAARRAHAAGKPVIVYKLGRSDAGARLAVSHSGAIAGDDAAADAFFRHHGIIRVEMLETMFEIAPLLRGQTPARGRKVGVLTTTGGGAAMVVDRLGLAGVEMTPPPPSLVRKLANLGLRIGNSPIIDLTMAGTKKIVYGTALDELLRSPDCDAVVAVVGTSAQFHPEHAVEPIVSAAKTGKPLAVFFVPEAVQSLKLVADAGMAAFRTPESCADGVRAYLDWRGPEAETMLSADLGRAKAALGSATTGTLSEHDAASIFEGLGIAYPASQAIRNPDEPSTIGFPLAAKILSPDIPHKSDAGGVVLGIANSAELKAAAQRIVNNVGKVHPNARIDGLLLQRMEKGLAEVLLGFRRDPQLGCFLVLGVGGVLAEVYKDFTMRVAPVSLATAHAMIQEVKGFAPIRGYRGLPKGDTEALARAIVALSQLARLESVREAEINPLIVKADGVVAVDGLVVLNRP